MMGTGFIVYASILECKNLAQLQNKKYYVLTLMTVAMVAS